MVSQAAPGRNARRQLGGIASGLGRGTKTRLGREIVMNSIYKLPLVLEPQPEGGYTITCPLLPELITEADDVSEIYPHVADALVAVIELYEDMKRPLPAVLRPLAGDAAMWTETLIPVVAA
jgi:antitoxin HicB